MCSVTPVDVESMLPDPSTQPWPMGDILPNEPLSADLDAQKVARRSTRRSSLPRV